jgi:hypothetical protein
MRSMRRKLAVESLEGRALLSSGLASSRPVVAEVKGTATGQVDRMPIGAIQGQMAASALSPLMTADGIAPFSFTDAGASLRGHGKFLAMAYSTSAHVNEQDYTAFAVTLDRKGFRGALCMILTPQTPTVGESLPANDHFTVSAFRYMPGKSPESGGRSTQPTAFGTATLTFPDGQPTVGESVEFTLTFRKVESRPGK